MQDRQEGKLEWDVLGYVQGSVAEVHRMPTFQSSADRAIKKAAQNFHSIFMLEGFLSFEVHVLPTRWCEDFVLETYVVSIGFLSGCPYVFNRLTTRGYVFHIVDYCTLPARLLR